MASSFPGKGDTVKTTVGSEAIYYQSGGRPNQARTGGGQDANSGRRSQDLPERSGQGRLAETPPATTDAPARATGSSSGHHGLSLESTSCPRRTRMARPTAVTSSRPPP